MKKRCSWFLTSFFLSSLYAYAVYVKMSFGSDFNRHAIVAESMTRGGDAPPHFLYQIVFILMNWITSASPVVNSMLVIFLIVFITSYFLFYFLSKENSSTVNKKMVYFVFFILISHPVTLLFFFDNHLYYGYFTSNVYHNPSIILLKPIALVNFFLVCQFLEKPVLKKIGRKNIFLIVLTTILSIITKPNYSIALLPVVFLILLYSTKKKKENFKRWYLVSLLIFIPSGLILIWQYMGFYSGGSKNSLGIAPFQIYLYFSQLWTVFPKLLLSILFPLSMLCFYGKEMMGNMKVKVSSFMFLLSILYAYLLYDRVGQGESGAGNFWWSVQISYFLLLFSCLSFFLKKNSQEEKRKKRYILFFIIGIHFISGIFWYISNIIPYYWSP